MQISSAEAVPLPVTVGTLFTRNTNYDVYEIGFDNVAFLEIQGKPISNIADEKRTVRTYTVARFRDVRTAALNLWHYHAS